jgi:hypothetical protein
MSNFNNTFNHFLFNNDNDNYEQFLGSNDNANQNNQPSNPNSDMNDADESVADDIFNRIQFEQNTEGLCDPIAVNLLSQGNSSTVKLTK